MKVKFFSKLFNWWFLMFQQNCLYFSAIPILVTHHKTCDTKPTRYYYITQCFFVVIYSGLNDTSPPPEMKIIPHNTHNIVYNVELIYKWRLFKFDEYAIPIITKNLLTLKFDSTCMIPTLFITEIRNKIYN